MGTRGLIGFITQAVRHGCYNHWDSYPDALGQEVVNLILSLTPEQIIDMARRVQQIEVRLTVPFRP